MSGTILSVSSTEGFGLINPDNGGPPLPFDQDDTIETTTLHEIRNKSLSQSLVGTTVTYVYDGASGKAKYVRIA